MKRCATNTNTETVIVYSAVTRKSGFGVNSWETSLTGHGFHSHFDLVSLAGLALRYVFTSGGGEHA